VSLSPRPALPDPSCEALAKTSPGAAWQEAGALPAGRLVLTDPSVLGGPFAPPLRLEGASGRRLRVLVAGEGARAKTICAQIVEAEGAVASWRSLGEAGVDTGVLLIGDEAGLLASLAPRQALAMPCAEAPAEELNRAVPMLRARGLALDPVLPTLACAPREATPQDRTLIAGALREIKGEGHYLIEPRNPALPAVAALGSRPWAAFPPAGLVVDVSAGDGLYPVRAGLDAAGKTLVIEIPLR